MRAVFVSTCSSDWCVALGVDLFQVYRQGMCLVLNGVDLGRQQPSLHNWTVLLSEMRHPLDRGAQNNIRRVLLSEKCIAERCLKKRLRSTMMIS